MVFLRLTSDDLVPQQRILVESVGIQYTAYMIVHDKNPTYLSEKKSITR